RPRAAVARALVRLPRPCHMARADDANLVARLVQCVSGLQHPRTRGEVTRGDNADSRAHMVVPVACQECTRRCASSASSTLPSITKRGIWNGSTSPGTNDGLVVNARSKP